MSAGRRRARVLAAAAIGALCVPGLGCGPKRPPKTPQNVNSEEVYVTALKKMAGGRYFAARNILQDLLPRIAPDDRELLPRVQMSIADAYYRDKGSLNYGEALNGYRTFLTYYPQHEMADRAQFMVGMSLFQQALSPDRDQTMTLQAIDEFSKMEMAFPQSPYVAQAREMLRICNDRLAAHELVIARFYQKRKAYLAAIDRYRLVLDKYPHFGSTDQVLFSLGQCLLKVGNRPEAEEFFARLGQENKKGDLSARAKQLIKDFDRQQAINAKKNKS